MEHPFVLQGAELAMCATDRWATVRRADDGRLILRRTGREQLVELATLLEERLLQHGSTELGTVTITTGTSSDVYFTGTGLCKRISIHAAADLAHWLRHRSGTAAALFLGDDGSEYTLTSGQGGDTELCAFNGWTFTFSPYQVPRLAEALLGAAKAVYSGLAYVFVIRSANGADLTLKCDDASCRCLLTSRDSNFELSLTAHSAAVMAERLLALQT